MCTSAWDHGAFCLCLVCDSVLRFCALALHDKDESALCSCIVVDTEERTGRASLAWVLTVSDHMHEFGK